MKFNVKYQVKLRTKSSQYRYGTAIVVCEFSKEMVSSSFRELYFVVLFLPEQVFLGSHAHRWSREGGESRVRGLCHHQHHQHHHPTTAHTQRRGRSLVSRALGLMAETQPASASF